jgi:hypothetical protein
MRGNLPLQFRGVGYMLDREYRNTPAYQWARELMRNGVEADAAEIRFGIEWNAVKARGVYRLQYADNGIGMSHDDLRDYMGTLGEGSKLVGGPHDNYALGCRMTLLPWNSEGVVVISVVDGVANMVKLKYDASMNGGAGEYVLEEIEWGDEDGNDHISTVYPPYFDDDEDIDWAATVPDFITKEGHGTTFILIGRNPNDDTLDGDTERGESLRFLTRKYFNTRLWQVPDGVDLKIIEFVQPTERAEWPKAEDDRKRYQYRGVKGARDVAEYVKRSGEETLQAKGVVELSDGTSAHWFLRNERTVDTGGVGSSSGFIAVQYRDELYGHAYANIDDGDTRVGAAVYRQFGIGAEAVRTRVFLILEPPEYDEITGASGIAPSTGRADLYWMGAGLSPRSVKPADWSDEFAEKMPAEIIDAINAAHDETKAMSEDREQRLKRVMDRFSKRWRVRRARASEDGDTTTRPTSVGTAPRTPIDSPTLRRKGKRRVVVSRHGRGGQTTIGQIGTGETTAKSTHVSLGIPTYEWVTEEDINDPGMIAAWQKPNKIYPNGCVQIAKDHLVIRNQVEFWQSNYPRAVAKQIEDIVMDAYSDVAVAKVAHLHALAGTVLSDEQRDVMLENPALSTSMLGLIAEDALISPRLGGLGTKRNRDQVAPNGTETAADDSESAA